MTRKHFLGSTLEAYDPPVRGDPITGARYYDVRWAKAEWKHVFSKAWHIGGMVTDLEEPVGMRPFKTAEREVIIYGEATLGYVADQDMSVAVGQQQGLHSMGYRGGIISGQEKRIQRFHELLNDAWGIYGELD